MGGPCAQVGSGGGGPAAQPRQQGQYEPRGLEPPCGAAGGPRGTWRPGRRRRGQRIRFVFPKRVRFICRSVRPGSRRYHGARLHVVERNSRPLRSRPGPGVGRVRRRPREGAASGTRAGGGGRPAGGATRAGRAGRQVVWGKDDELLFRHMEPTPVSSEGASKVCKVAE